jgi:hypothetical protein
VHWTGNRVEHLKARPSSLSLGPNQREQQPCWTSLSPQASSLARLCNPATSRPPTGDVHIALDTATPPDTTSIPHRPSSRAWREEVARNLLAHASSPSPPLTPTPRRPEPPLSDQTPAGHRSAASVRGLAGTCKRPKPPPTPPAKSPPPSPANAEAAPPLPSLLFALARRALPRGYKARTPSLLPFLFARPHHHHPHSLTERTQSKPAPLPSGQGALRLPGHRGERWPWRPFLTENLCHFHPLPLPCLAALTRRFSCDQAPSLEPGRSSLEQ